MDWTTVYDFGNDSLRVWWMLIPIAFVLIGYGLAVFFIFFTSGKVGEKIKNVVFALLFGTFGLLFGLATIPSDLTAYNETKILYESKNFKVIEGVVDNFSPMPRTGHQNEKFTLNGIPFSYSDFDESYYGFNNTKSHGGPIDKDKMVRLSYFESENRNIILKIEVPK